MDRTKYLTPTEVAQLRRTTENWALADLSRGRRQGPLAWMVVDFALSTGLRVSEITEVQIASLDLKAGYCTVFRRKKRRRTGRQIKDKSTGQMKDEWEPIRKPESLKLDQDIIRHLREFLAWREAVNPGRSCKSLWLGKRGPMTPQGLEVIWKRAILLAGMTKRNAKTGKMMAKYSIHAARHTLATMMYNATQNAKMVQRQCGHGSVATTLDMYCHISDDDMAAGLEKVKSKVLADQGAAATDKPQKRERKPKEAAYEHEHEPTGIEGLYD